MSYLQKLLQLDLREGESWTVEDSRVLFTYRHTDQFQISQHVLVAHGRQEAGAWVLDQMAKVRSRLRSRILGDSVGFNPSAHPEPATPAEALEDVICAYLAQLPLAEIGALLRSVNDQTFERCVERELCARTERDAKKLE